MHLLMIIILCGYLIVFFTIFLSQHFLFSGEEHSVFINLRIVVTILDIESDVFRFSL
jgi:hypothetical protein